MNQIKKQNDPNKHHFLPVFYLKQWARADGRLVQFSRPYGNKVKALSRHPDAIGYIYRLYAAEGLPEELANLFEREFTRPVDGAAAGAMHKLMNKQSQTDITGQEGYAWARFIVTLMMRMPDDVRKMKHFIKENWFTDLPFLEAAFKASKMPGSPRTKQDYLDLLGPWFFERSAMILLGRVMQNNDIIDAIGSMDWTITRTDGVRREFLTSDRPLIITNELFSEQAHIVLPVGPNRVFIATRKRGFYRQLMNRPPKDFITAVNKHLVNNATDYVYGRTDGALGFIQKEMGKNRQSTFVDRLHEARMRELQKPLSERRDLAVSQ